MNVLWSWGTTSVFATDSNLSTRSVAARRALSPCSEKKLRSSTRTIVGCNESRILERCASRERALVPLIMIVKEGNPVQRVNKHYVHGCLFGAPYR